MAKARILAVDDQRYFRELIAGMLADEGFEAQTASSAEEALHVLENSDFDIVLTDLVMPGMDGSELVHRIKERDPEQEIVVVTGVVDVKTAVDAMKLGATDYLLKPFDRRTLSVSLEGILQSRRLKVEHARLLAENIEYIGERTLYERALGIFSTLSIEPLAVRIAEALCLETRAQGGVLWVAGEDDSEELDLAAARGLVRLADEPETIELSELPEELLDGSARTALEAWGDGASETPALYAVLRCDGRIRGLVRLTDKLEGEEFDAVDRACVEKFMQFADVAVANATRVQQLERRSLQDPGTGAYNFDYFQDMVRNEIEKANRFGRSLGLFKLDLGPLAELRRVVGDDELPSRLAGVAELLGRMLRAADLLAVDSAYRFYVLLAEADALGAAVLKRRTLQALESSELVAGLERQVRPRAGVAIYPGDGTQLESLLRALDARIREGEHSKVAALGLDRLSLAAGLQALVRLGSPERPETAQQLASFVLDEVARRPRERGLLYVAPGIALEGVVRRGLEALRDVSARTEVVVIGDGERPSFPVGDVSWISSRRAPGLPPCLIHYRDGPAYALVREEGRNGAPARLFHTSDRSLVEHLTFRLQEELAVPPVLGHEGGG
jgi:diguanylate cyclase (GGDEF)-like protein